MTLIETQLVSIPVDEQRVIFDGIAHRIENDWYEYEAINGGVKYAGTSSIISAIISNVGAASGQWTLTGTQLTGVGGTTYTMPTFGHITIQQLSETEKKELDALEQEHKQYVKLNKVKKFQALPKHIRQEIVDDALLKELITSLGSNDDRDFEHIQKLNDLRAKNNNWGNGMIGAVSIGYSDHYDSFNSKYALILKHFTTQELSEAHAQASLEEAINN